ncbi:MAG: methyltransferase domain-containing protein [bacterium]|nr:methyltransferase domain-containing protein [bacterium]
MPNFHPLQSIAYAISARNRKKKYAEFLSLVQPTEKDTLLDVGVNIEEYSPTDNFLEKHYPCPEKITAVGMGNLQAFRTRYPNIQSIDADGRALPFADNTFDIAYSNAVIEHVGSTDEQLRFLRELYRVSRRGYLTTPNRFFPIEIHTRIPLLHILLSKKNFDTFLSHIGKAWAAGDYMHLLSEKELRTLLKKAHITNYIFVKNRFLWFPMTFTIVWKKA